MSKQQTGKGKYGTRQYVEAFPLDGAKLTAVYRANVAAIYGEDMSTEGRDVRDGEYVALRVKGMRNPAPDEETWAVICTEGVGWTPDEYNVIQVPVLGYFGQSSRLFIYVERIPEMFTGETVDLADHIRTFGDRLEGNFDLWAGHAVSQESVPA